MEQHITTSQATAAGEPIFVHPQITNPSHSDELVRGPSILSSSIGTHSTHHPRVAEKSSNKASSPLSIRETRSNPQHATDTASDHSKGLSLPEQVLTLFRSEPIEVNLTTLQEDCSPTRPVSEPLLPSSKRVKYGLPCCRIKGQRCLVHNYGTDPLGEYRKFCRDTNIADPTQQPISRTLPIALPHPAKATKTGVTRSRVNVSRQILGAEDLFGTEVPKNAPTTLKNADGRKVKLNFDFRTKLPTNAEAKAQYVKNYNIRLDEHGNPRVIRANMEDDDGQWKAFTEGQRMAYDYLMRAKNDQEYADYLAHADQLDIADQISRQKAERKRNMKRSAPVDELSLARSKLLCQSRAFDPTTPVDNPLKYQRILQPHNWILHQPSEDPGSWYFAEADKPADDGSPPREDPKPRKFKVVAPKNSRKTTKPYKLRSSFSNTRSLN